MSGRGLCGYRYSHGGTSPAHDYLLPMAFGIAERWAAPPGPLFDLGCGNGSVAARFAGRGYEVTGVDPSLDGIDQAHRNHPDLKIHEGSAYDDLASRYGRFPLVYSLEVVEHVYSPRAYASTLFDLVDPGGKAVVSTPYHGYLKNIALALSGRLDSHFTALWDHGHIKFWSVRTLEELLLEAGFSRVDFAFAGRVRPLAKSMIAIAHKR